MKSAEMERRQSDEWLQCRRMRALIELTVTSLQLNEKFAGKGQGRNVSFLPIIGQPGARHNRQKIALRVAGKGLPSALPYGVFGEIRVLYFYPVPVFSMVLVLSIGPRLENLDPYPRPNKTGPAILAVQE